MSHFPCSMFPSPCLFQVGLAKLKENADDRANIGGTIIGALIVGQ